MPNCFNLTRKSAPEAGPVSLTKIDEELCGYLGVEPHPSSYLAQWFDIIGFKLAMGRTFNEVRSTLAADLADCRKDGDTDLEEYYERLLVICDWLDSNFTPNAWAERHR